MMQKKDGAKPRRVSATCCRNWDRPAHHRLSDGVYAMRDEENTIKAVNTVLWIIWGWHLVLALFIWGVLEAIG